MTPDRRLLSELLEKAGADDILCDRIGFVAQRLMELDLDNRGDASHGERTEARPDSCHGYRDRAWETRAVSSFPPFLEPHRREGPGGRDSRKPPSRASRPVTRRPSTAWSEPGSWSQLVTPASLPDPGDPCQPRRASQHPLARGRKLIGFQTKTGSMTFRSLLTPDTGTGSNP